MNITRIDVNKKWSRAVIHNGVAYFCGQVAERTDVGLAEQTQSALERLDALLRQVGSDRTKLLTVTIYLKSGQSVTEMNQVWETWVPEGCAPARVCIEAAATDPEYLVEIVATATIN